MLNQKETQFLDRAIELSEQGIAAGKGGPFGCVIVKDGEIIAEGCNMVLATNDPTAHAEIVAIREACKKLNSFQLHDCEIFASCEPCPMCLGAIYWARPKKVVFSNTRRDAATIEFDDEFIYQELNADYIQRKIPFIHHPTAAALEVFKRWKEIDNKKLY